MFNALWHNKRMSPLCDKWPSLCSPVTPFNESLVSYRVHDCSMSAVTIMGSAGHCIFFHEMGKSEEILFFFFLLDDIPLFLYLRKIWTAALNTKLHVGWEMVK